MGVGVGGGGGGGGWVRKWGEGGVGGCVREDRAAAVNKAISCLGGRAAHTMLPHMMLPHGSIMCEQYLVYRHLSCLQAISRLGWRAAHTMLPHGDERVCGRAHTRAYLCAARAHVRVCVCV